MKKFEIANRNSGHVLGIYDGETKEEALDAMARDAGYSSYAAIPEEAGSADDLIITEVTSARYIVSPVADANCEGVTGKVLIETDDLAEATKVCDGEGSRYIYGSAISDTLTGKIDFGHGFGVPVPDPDNDY